MKTSHQHILPLALLLLATGLAGCVTPATQPPPARLVQTDLVPLSRIQIADEFSIVELSTDNLPAQARQCVSTLVESSKSVQDLVQGFPKDRSTVILGHTASASRFMVMGRQGICLRYSETRYPILPVEAFQGTVNPVLRGDSTAVVNGWFRQIADTLARNGSVKVAYAFKNGNAFIATYSVQDPVAPTLHYSSRFKRAGEWESERVDLKFSDATMSSVVEYKVNGKTEKPNLLSHRRKPGTIAPAGRSGISI
ncbi:MAG: hypothetical protein RLZZ271_263 [Pseudomonadota bacterium]|jgi:hypothetical protein